MEREASDAKNQALHLQNEIKRLKASLEETRMDKLNLESNLEQSMLKVREKEQLSRLSKQVNT